jgi:predicted transcriptional regulator
LAAPEAMRACRLGFANRLAAAVLAPAARLAVAAREQAFDPLRLSQRFALRPSLLLARFAALGAGGRLPPAFAITIDVSGGVLARIPGAGFPFPRFGPLCARLPLFDALRPGEVGRAEVVLPDGGVHLALAVAEDGVARDGLPPARRLALAGWRREDVAEIARAWPPFPTRGIGVTCRLCERLDCSHRMHPPATRPAALHEHVVGPSDYEMLG